jgi:hypothetical protein
MIIKTWIWLIVVINVAAHFFLKFLSNLVLSLKDRFDKVKDHK